jgi:hypothetical protein
MEVRLGSQRSLISSLRQISAFEAVRIRPLLPKFRSVCMCKSSIDYAELAGLRISIRNLELEANPARLDIINWMRERIHILENL